METAKNTLLAVLAVIVVVALAIGAWQLGWFVEEKNVDRQTQVNDQSQGRQQALTSKVLRDIETVREIDGREDDGTNTARREALVESICMDAGQLSGSVTMPTSATNFINSECP